MGEGEGGSEEEMTEKFILAVLVVICVETCTLSDELSWRFCEGCGVLNEKVLNASLFLRQE